MFALFLLLPFPHYPLSNIPFGLSTKITSPVGYHTDEAMPNKEPLLFHCCSIVRYRWGMIIEPLDSPVVLFVKYLCRLEYVPNS